MKTEVLQNVTSSREKESIISIIKTAFMSGVFGYILFLAILLATKGLSSYIIKNIGLELEATDFILPVIGFVLIALIKFLENYKNDEDF